MICIECVKLKMSRRKRADNRSLGQIVMFIRAFVKTLKQSPSIEYAEQAVAVCDGDSLCQEHLLKALDIPENWRDDARDSQF